MFLNEILKVEHETRASGDGSFAPGQECLRGSIHSLYKGKYFKPKLKNVAEKQLRQDRDRCAQEF
jgi:hypothetical protein